MKVKPGYPIGYALLYGLPRDLAYDMQRIPPILCTLVYTEKL